MKRKQVASALMLVAYFTTHTPVTPESITESALQTALSSRSPLAESGKQHFAAYPSHGELQYTQNPEIYYPYYQYQYPPNPYYGYPNGRYFYPPNGYQNGIGGYPQSVLNRYPNYPPYGYQLPNGYPYRTVYQYPNVYYPYQYRRLGDKREDTSKETRYTKQQNLVSEWMASLKIRNIPPKLS